MKKTRVALLLLLSMALLLFGCGKTGTPEESASGDKITIDGNAIGLTSSEEPSTTETSEEVVSREGMIRSPLTNEWVDESFENIRPIAVMIPNDNGASGCLPQYGISRADVYYEVPVEGGITRTMAVMLDHSGLDRLGNVRSARDYYVYWAFEWDAIFFHYGNPFYADWILGQEYTDRVNGGSAPSGVFYRVSEPGRVDWQNAYLTSDGIDQAIKHYGYSTTYTNNYKGAHYNFSDTVDLSDSPKSFDCTKVDLAKCFTVNKPYFEYNADEDVYYRFQYGDEHIDGANDVQLSFKNIILQNTTGAKRDAKGYMAFSCHDTTKDGWYITGGKAIPVTWEKTGDFEPTKYYDMNGKEITVETGKTMVCILWDENGTPSFE